MKILVVVPTYNERENIKKILDEILRNKGVNVLIIDDNSPDGTAEIVETHKEFDKKVFLIKRPAKLGLGTAYIMGFKWGLSKGYEIFFEMDADLSHDPKDIPNFISKINSGCDLVIGSRYIGGTISVVGWDFKRLLLSKFANWYATTILSLKNLTDITSGYRAYTRKCLEAIDLDEVKSNGYSFQIEMAYKAVKAGLKVCEVPIIFYERAGGSSKMNRKIALEAALMVWRLKVGQ